MDTAEVVTEVPECMKKLIKLVMRGFYTVEAMLIIDLLLRHACLKEEQIMDCLKLDKKQMGNSLKTLKNDQFIKQRMKVESDNEKTTKHNYYFINYSGFVNVCKYKLDHARKKLEMQERESTSRASFKCEHCLRTYTDLEADRLIDMITGQFKCMMCGSEMEEQQSSAPVKDARALIAKFNEQIERLYDLLKKCDKFKLHQSVLNPEPTDIRALTGEKKPTSGSTSSGQPKSWSGDATRNIEFGIHNATIDVKVGDEATAQPTAVVKKDQPAWMQKSTIEGVSTNVLPQRDVEAPAASDAQTSLNADSNIMNALRVHEYKNNTAAALPAAGSDKSDESDMEEVDAADGGNAEVEEEELMITIGGKRVPFHEASELVDQMTHEEREQYNKLAQSVYMEMYDD